ncbi:MAG: hypothetical protein AB7O97_14170 [Planctomycetota bacterium]
MIRSLLRSRAAPHPATAPVAQYMGGGFLFPILMSVFLVRDLWLGIPVLILFAAAIGWILFEGFRGGHPNSPGRLLRRLRADLSWLELDPVQPFARDAEPALRAALERHGVRVLELDGDRIESLTAFVRELTQRIDMPRFPQEPPARLSAALLALRERCRRDKQPCAIVWRDAGHLARTDWRAFAAIDRALDAVTMDYVFHSLLVFQGDPLPAGAPAAAPAELQPIGAGSDQGR